MFSIAVCDDDTNMLKKLVECIEQTRDKCNVDCVIYKSSDSRKFLHKIQNDYFDVVVLDIQMPDISGFKIAQYLNKKTKLIFVSGYDELVFDSFEYDVHYFIRKKEIKRLYAFIENIFVEYAEKYISFDTTGTENIRVSANDIVYIESDKNYINICIYNCTVYKIRATLKDFEYILENKKFFKANKGTIINVNYIKKIDDVVAFVKKDDTSDFKRFTVTQNRIKNLKNEFFAKGLTDV